MAPDLRTTGLPYHLFYPLISAILLAIAAFSGANSVCCGYRVSNLVITSKLGCIRRGWQYQIPDNYFGFPLPDDIAHNLSKVVITSVIAFVLVLLAGVHHAYTIRYSFRKSPDPDKDKLYSLAQIHFIHVTVVFLFTWIAFVSQAAVIGHAISLSGDVDFDNGVAINWGQSVWLVLAAAVVHTGWGYEAVRWRHALVR